MLDKKLLEGKREIKIKQGYFRCIHCGRDVERLYAMVYNVNESTFNKILEISTKESGTQILKKERYDNLTVKKLDDITLKPIKGNLFNVNINVCMSCVKKVGHRHKYFQNFKNRLYATKIV